MASIDNVHQANENANISICVHVGYGWKKVEDDIDTNGRSVLSDVFWQTIKDAFESKHSAVEKNGVKVAFSRLRSSHGKVIWTSVLDHIKEADILIFDVAAAPEANVIKNDFDLGQMISLKSDGMNVLNANVLIEIGAAIALGKRVMLLCPYGWRKFIPSDLTGYHWTFYNWNGTGKESRRQFVDAYGMQNGYIAMLREVVSEKISKAKLRGTLA